MGLLVDVPLLGQLTAFFPAILLAASVFYFCALGLYRLTLHPLAKFPGPKVSAFTGWYEFYLDLLGAPRRTFAFRVQRMHEKYGPIVRINPHELHVSDPDFFDVLNAGGSARRDKYPPSASVQGTPDGIFGTVGHEAHRRRRGAVSGFFSKQSLLRDEHLVHDKANLLCNVFRSAMNEGRAINVRVPLLAFGTDFYCAHALGERGNMHLLEDETKAQVWRDSIVGLLHVTPVVRQFPWVLPYAFGLPSWFIRWISSDMALVVDVFTDILKQAEATVDESKRPKAVDKGRSNLMDTILASELPRGEKTADRIAQEGFTILTASGDTLGRVMTTAIYHLHCNPEYLARLREELKEMMPDPDADVPLTKIESLPWLTPVGMTTSELMLDPAAFPEPKRFDPGRWEPSHPLYAQSTRHFVAFSRGHRNCIGLNLAWAQMYIALAKILRRFELELFDVVRERDIDHHRDCFLGEPRDDTKGVRVKVLGLLE
ncbi:Trichodiene oxygenase [Colletotrichum higginsianum]|uniref:Trichodiene oxygenase n=1 Tax=Colletotrichum higginsianum TaxID=80884 RepID=A0A4T0W8P1_9PEZI|nr:Trichodiene oxygenase [Colletotrichum higginsianum]